MPVPASNDKKVVVKVKGKNIAVPAEALMPAETKPIESVYIPYGFPEELVDSPKVWEEENYYFGQTPPSTPAPAEKPSWWQNLIQTAVPAYLQYKQQREFQKLNIERARQGLPPISVEEYRAMTPPAATVEVGMSPQTRNMLLLGGLGLGALLLFTMKRGK